MESRISGIISAPCATAAAPSEAIISLTDHLEALANAHTASIMLPDRQEASFGNAEAFARPAVPQRECMFIWGCRANEKPNKKPTFCALTKVGFLYKLPLKIISATAAGPSAKPRSASFPSGDPCAGSVFHQQQHTLVVETALG